MTFKYNTNQLTGNRVPVIIEGARSPFVRSFGVLGDCDALELYSRTIDGLIRKTDAPVEAYEEIICGVVTPQVKNTNVARDTILNLGLPHHIHGYTLNRMCTSSLETIGNAVKNVMTGHARMILAGGVDVLSDVPITYTKDARKSLLRLNKAKTTGEKASAMGSFIPKALAPKAPGITEPLTGMTMGEHAEVMAKLNGISRRDQDAFSVLSHQRAAAAQESGIFRKEIIPVWPSPGFTSCIDKDNIIRPDSSMESLGQLRPAFDRKYGTITAGNASSLTDGAAAVIIADEAHAKSLGLKPKAKIRDVVFVGVNPYEQLLIGPALTIPMILMRNKLGITDIDLFEIHEAFAAQVLSCLRSMESADFCSRHLGLSSAFGAIPEDKINVNGGAIAIGHPFGATGARLVLSMTNELEKRSAKFGVIAICAAGGMSGAMLIERI
jgi:acetyl-CoA acyltransferase